MAETKDQEETTLLAKRKPDPGCEDQADYPKKTQKVEVSGNNSDGKTQEPENFKSNSSVTEEKNDELEGNDEDEDDEEEYEEEEEEEEEDGGSGGEAVDEGRGSTTTSRADCEADELCNLLKSRVECPDFLEKLECAQASVPKNIPAEEGNSWDLVSEKDLWEYEDDNLGEEEYVLVKQEDIVEGIACFMAAYLLSLKETKELTPTQLQEALSKTFSVKKKKGKLRKAWDGSKVIYNVASWGATAIGIYQNPVIVRAATKAFWTSCQVISKLL